MHSGLNGQVAQPVPFVDLLWKLGHALAINLSHNTEADLTVLERQQWSVLAMSLIQQVSNSKMFPFAIQKRQFIYIFSNKNVLGPTNYERTISSTGRDVV